MLGFCLSFQFFVLLLFIYMHKVFCDSSCSPPSDKQSEIYHSKRYNGGSHLTCVENIGLRMCVNLCEKTVGCRVVNFDRYKSHCSLVKETREITVDDMVTAETKDFVAVMNESTVSQSSTINIFHILRLKIFHEIVMIVIGRQRTSECLMNREFLNRICYQIEV